jgi:hypothetical protein
MCLGNNSGYMIYEYIGYMNEQQAKIGTERKPVFRIRIQDFDDQEMEKFTAEKKSYLSHHKLQFTNPWASIKDVQATGEAFALKRDHPALQNIKFLFYILVDPDPIQIRIRIQNTGRNTTKGVT